MSTSVRRIISTNLAPKAIGAYSQAVVVNGMVYVSGQLGLNPESMKLVPGGAAAETKQALENMKNILEAANSSLSNVVKATVLLKDIKDFQAVNEVYKSYFLSNPPARAAYQVANLPANGNVEIEAIGIVGEVVTVE